MWSYACNRCNSICIIFLVLVRQSKLYHHQLSWVFQGLHARKYVGSWNQYEAVIFYVMVGLFLELRNTTWGQGFQFHRPTISVSWERDTTMTFVESMLWTASRFYFEETKTSKYLWLCMVMWRANQMPRKLFFCYILRCCIRDPYPIQTTPISLPTTLETEKQSLLPQCNFPRFSPKMWYSDWQTSPVRYVLRMTERSRGLESPSLMELTSGGGSGTRWLMETKFG